MKYFVLLITLFYLYSTIKSIINIKILPTLKQSVDNALNSPQFTKEKDINKRYGDLILCYTIGIVIVSLCIIFCAVYINSFVFTIIAFLYILWSSYDTNNSIGYLNHKKVIKPSSINEKMDEVLNNMIDKINSNIAQSTTNTQSKEIKIEYKMPKTFDSKLYKIFSIPFDLGFALYIIYIIFTRWI